MSPPTAAGSPAHDSSCARSASASASGGSVRPRSPANAVKPTWSAGTPAVSLGTIQRGRRDELTTVIVGSCARSEAISRPEIELPTTRTRRPANRAGPRYALEWRTSTPSPNRSSAGICGTVKRPDAATMPSTRSVSMRPVATSSTSRDQRSPSCRADRTRAPKRVRVTTPVRAAWSRSSSRTCSAVGNTGQPPGPGGRRSASSRRWCSPACRARCRSARRRCATGRRGRRRPRGPGPRSRARRAPWRPRCRRDRRR